MSKPKHKSRSGGISDIMIKHFSLLAVLIAILMTSTVGFADEHVPSLVGRWIGTCNMHHKQLGFTENKLEYVVEEQRGRVFKGYKTLIMLHDKSNRKEGIAGVITKDNKTFYIANHIDGLEFGNIDSKNELTIYYH